MSTSKNVTLSQDQLQAEWLEVQAAQQNPADFRVLYSRYYAPIFRFLYNRLLDEETTGDLCAQVFLKAIQNLSKYSFQGVPFSAWLYRIATNELNGYYRQTQKKRVIALEDYHTSALQNEDDGKEVLELNIEALQKVIHKLDADDVMLLELRFFEKRSFREVGEILDMTENNAKVRLYRLLDKMRKLFSSP
jgi:RNA polymerase sigma-70 factor (ECF subfamily)